MKVSQITYDDIYDLYITKQLSQRDVAANLGIGQTTVRRLLNKFQITSRTSIESKNTDSYKVKLKKCAERYSKEYKIYRTKQCAFCEKEFVVDGEHKKNKFCSVECQKAAYKKEHPRKIYFCKLCGAPIILEGRNYKRIYCDNCKDKWRSYAFSKKITVKCAYCGKDIEATPSRVETYKHLYCDMGCMAKHYAIIYTGENSPTWKGGKGHHYIGGFYTQRKLARKRDNYTCQLCNITEEEYGKELSVHHIKNYRLFNDKVEANKLENLICLCEPCHRFVHSNSNEHHIFINNDI